MSVRFADTNVLLYAVSTDPAEQEKARTARRILEDRELRLSVQVLQEFYVQATRASRTDALTHEQACELVVTFLRFTVQETTRAVLLGALVTCRRYGISYWDAAIIEAARAAGAEVVLSEDLNHGQDYDGMVVEDPFRSMPASTQA